MLEKRFAIETCAADLQIAQKTLDHLANGQNTSQDEIGRAALKAKKLEVKLTAAKLAQSEYYLSSLRARIDYLQARCSQESGATQREQAELAWAREALPVNSQLVNRLAAELEKIKLELDALQKESRLI